MDCECDNLRDKMRNRAAFCRECGDIALDEIEALQTKIAMLQAELATAQEPDESLRVYPGGATRNPLGDKVQWFGKYGLFSIPALRAYGDYMRRHRAQHGTTELRDFNNWRQSPGIPQSVCVDSAGRHYLDIAEMDDTGSIELYNVYTDETVTMVDSVCAVIFNMLSILNSLAVEK